MFPITIGTKNVTPKKKDYEKYGGLPICVCAGVPPKFGIKVTFFEPTRLVDVTRIPYCLVGLGGISVGTNTVRKHGTVRTKEDTSRGSFYNVHWYIYPLIYWLELLTDFECVEKSRFDVAYMTEFDPTWNDDEWSWIQNPEAGFFAFPAVQLACVADCLAASNNTPINKLFWCAGCQGSLYPFSGFVEHHVGGLQASSLLVTRIIAKFHRLGVAKGYKPDEFCKGHFEPRIMKTLYKSQLVYPVSATCQPLGTSGALWGAFTSFPYKGEDFCYLVWKKKKCCMGTASVQTGGDF